MKSILLKLCLCFKVNLWFKSLKDKTTIFQSDSENPSSLRRWEESFYAAKYHVKKNKYLLRKWSIADNNIGPHALCYYLRAAVMCCRTQGSGLWSCSRELTSDNLSLWSIFLSFWKCFKHVFCYCCCLFSCFLKP